MIEIIFSMIICKMNEYIYEYYYKYYLWIKIKVQISEK